MTDRLTEIKERAEKATPGSWTFWSHVGLKRSDRTVLGENFQGVEFGGMNRTLTNRDDSVFIAHARDDIPFLLAEVERLRGIIEEARTTLEAGHTAAYDLRSDLNDVLSRVSQVEEGS